MAYNAYITRLKNVHKHPNADRLQIGECFGNSIVVSLDYEDNQLGIYFPSDGQLSVEFADANNLLRKKDENGNNIGGYMDADKHNVTAISASQSWQHQWDNLGATELKLDEDDIAILRRDYPEQRQISRVPLR